MSQTIKMTVITVMSAGWKDSYQIYSRLSLNHKVRALIAIFNDLDYVDYRSNSSWTSIRWRTNIVGGLSDLIK